MKNIKLTCRILLICMAAGLFSCNSAGNRNNNEKNNTDLGGNSMDSARNLNVTKYNNQPSKQRNAQYLMKIYASGLYEIKASQEALEHSQNDKVNALAQNLIKDYTQLNKQTKKLADQKQFSIPGSLTPQQEKDFKLLQSEKAGPFNEDYLRQMVNMHKDAIDLLNEAKKSDDEAIINWANTILPKIRNLLDQVTTVQSTLDAK